jgi:hypothetical protein
LRGRPCEVKERLSVCAREYFICENWILYYLELCWRISKNHAAVVPLESSANQPGRDPLLAGLHRSDHESLPASSLKAWKCAGSTYIEDNYKRKILPTSFNSDE